MLCVVASERNMMWRTGNRLVAPWTGTVGCPRSGSIVLAVPVVGEKGKVYGDPSPAGAGRGEGSLVAIHAASGCSRRGVGERRQRLHAVSIRNKVGYAPHIIFHPACVASCGTRQMCPASARRAGGRSVRYADRPASCVSSADNPCGPSARTTCSCRLRTPSAVDQIAQHAQVIDRMDVGSDRQRGSTGCARDRWRSRQQRRRWCVSSRYSMIASDCVITDRHRSASAPAPAD